MPRRILLLTIATVAAFATIASNADAAMPEQVNAALRASPCYGQPITVLWDPSLEARGFGALATGAHYVDGRGSAIVVDRCEITRNPIDWAKLTPAERCEQNVHEVAHLAGLDDGTGVMESKPERRYWAPCHTLRDRIRHDMAAMVPDTDPFVVCRPWAGRVLPCRVEFVDSRERAHVVWFRARVRVEVYAISRARAPRVSPARRGSGR